MKSCGPIDAMEIKAPKYSTHQTIYRYFTDEDTKMWRMKIISDEACKESHGSFAFKDFMKLNHSGDVTTLRATDKAYLDKWVALADEKYGPEATKPITEEN